MHAGSSQKMATLQLTDLQQQSITLAKQGFSFFLSGAAGTGKSYIINYIRNNCRNVEVTASTGIAAENIGGITLHSFAGVGLAKERIEKLIKKVKSNFKSTSRWLMTEVLIIDEISMISAELLDIIDTVGKAVRNCDKPFGGIQVIVVGDFYQLPPVEGDFAFEADIWPQIVGTRVVILDQVFRQSDPVFLKALHEIRIGQLTDESFKYITENSNSIEETNGILPTILFSKNTEVDEINEKRLAELPGTETVYKAFDSINPKFARSVINFPVSDILSLKPGAQVILLKNTTDYKNGTRGVIVKCDDETAHVQTLNGVFQIQPENFDVYLGKKKIATRRMMPIKLAWAMTIHRSQGLTIDLLQIDLGSVFSPAQTYTALSRARTVQGLKVNGLSQRVVYCDEKVREYYESLLSKSSNSSGL